LVAEISRKTKKHSKCAKKKERGRTADDVFHAKGPPNKRETRLMEVLKRKGKTRNTGAVGPVGRGDLGNDNREKIYLFGESYEMGGETA